MNAGLSFDELLRRTGAQAVALQYVLEDEVRSGRVIAEDGGYCLAAGVLLGCDLAELDPRGERPSTMTTRREPASN